MARIQMAISAGADWMASSVELRTRLNPIVLVTLVHQSRSEELRVRYDVAKRMFIDVIPPEINRENLEQNISSALNKNTQLEWIVR